MTKLRLGKLPDRTPVKLTIILSPDLKKTLDDYALLYGETYGASEPIAELVPEMIEAFLSSDREFTKARAALRKHERG